MENRLAQLRQFITEHCSLEELRTLCFDLGVNFDDLRGEALSGKAGALILELGRQQRLHRLLAALQKDRSEAYDCTELGMDAAPLYTELPAFEAQVYPPSLWDCFRQKKMVFYPTILIVGLVVLVTVTAGVVGVLADAGGAEQQLRKLGLLPALTPTLTPTLTPLPDSGFNIGVAQFTATDQAADAASDELSQWLFKTIENEARGFRDSSLRSLSFDVRGPDHIGPVPGQDPGTRAAHAAEVARQHNVTVLIYGVVTSKEQGHFVLPEFYVSEQGFSFGDEAIGPDRLGQPIGFELPLDRPQELFGVNTKLYARATALRHLVRGLAFYYVNQFDEANTEFRRAANVAEWRPDEGQEVVHLLMGAAQLGLYADKTSDLDRRSRALGQAAVDFTEAYRLNPDYARSHLGLGAVNLQQATLLDAEWTRIVGVDGDKLIEAERWYSSSLSAPDQHATAFVPVKAAYGLGQIHLVGYEFGVPGWSREDARRFLIQVISAYDPENAPELAWYVGNAHFLMGQLEYFEQDWSAASSECRQAIDVLGTISYASARRRTMVADYWEWVAAAEIQLGELEKARWAYRQAIEAGEGCASAKELEKWQAALACLEKGDACREP